MDKKIYEKFKNLIYEVSGISLGDKKKVLLSSRIKRRMKELQISDYEEYYYYLLKDKSGRELMKMIDVVSTKHTYFFRELEHFKFLEQFFRHTLKKKIRKFRVWSAACASGEEPYSIAMVLHEVMDQEKVYKVDIKILATDISHQALLNGMEAIYPFDAVKMVPPPFLQKFFYREGKYYRLKENVRKMVKFRYLNLSTPPFPMREVFDVVFCRNVMIYFDSIVKKKLLKEIYRVLKKKGILIISHAENLMGLNLNFKYIKASIYKK